MTREEAIKVLNMVEAHGSLVIQAKDMAIKALSQEPICYPPCTDCNRKMDEIRHAYDKLKEQEPCDDAVSCEAFKNHLYENYCVPVSKIGKPNQYSSGCFYKDIVKCLDELPSVTQKSGQWIEERDDYGEIQGWHCSECYEDTGFTTDCKWKYCPNCGAKMEG